MNHSPKKLKEPRLVRVEWEDSEAWSGVWDRIESVREAYRADGFDTIQTVGYLIDERPDGILLAMSLHFDKGQSTASRGAMFYSIPRGCIRKVTTLRQSEGAK